MRKIIKTLYSKIHRNLIAHVKYPVTSQSKHCQNRVCTSFPNSNFIYIDYTLVKHYLCPDNYNISHKYFIQLHEEILKTYSHFNICADLKSLTLTAIHRYMDLGKKVCALYLHSNKQSKQIDQIHIRNPPSFLQTAIKLFSPFISHDTLAKIRLV